MFGTRRHSVAGFVGPQTLKYKLPLAHITNNKSNFAVSIVDRGRALAAGGFGEPKSCMIPWLIVHVGAAIINWLPLLCCIRLVPIQQLVFLIGRRIPRRTSSAQGTWKTRPWLLASRPTWLLECGC